MSEKEAYSSVPDDSVDDILSDVLGRSGTSGERFSEMYRRYASTDVPDMSAFYRPETPAKKEAAPSRERESGIPMTAEPVLPPEPEHLYSFASQPVEETPAQPEQPRFKEEPRPAEDGKYPEEHRYTADVRPSGRLYHVEQPQPGEQPNYENSARANFGKPSSESFYRYTHSEEKRDTEPRYADTSRYTDPARYEASRTETEPGKYADTGRYADAGRYGDTRRNAGSERSGHTSRSRFSPEHSPELFAEEYRAAAEKYDVNPYQYYAQPAYYSVPYTYYTQPMIPYMPYAYPMYPAYPAYPVYAPQTGYCYPQPGYEAYYAQGYPQQQPQDASQTVPRTPGQSAETGERVIYDAEWENGGTPQRTPRGTYAQPPVQPQSHRVPATGEPVSPAPKNRTQRKAPPKKHPLTNRPYVNPAFIDPISDDDDDETAVFRNGETADAGAISFNRRRTGNSGNGGFSAEKTDKEEIFAAFSEDYDKQISEKPRWTMTDEEIKREREERAPASATKTDKPAIRIPDFVADAAYEGTQQITEPVIPDTENFTEYLQNGGFAFGDDIRPEADALSPKAESGSDFIEHIRQTDTGVVVPDDAYSVTADNTQMSSEDRQKLFDALADFGKEEQAAQTVDTDSPEQYTEQESEPIREITDFDVSDDVFADAETEDITVFTQPFDEDAVPEQPIVVDEEFASYDSIENFDDSIVKADWSILAQAEPEKPVKPPKKKNRKKNKK